ncbi:MAG: hypothetical protein V3V31_04930 [Methylococcales bacterium]
MAALTECFKNRYLASLNYYKSFYDDLSEYGNPANTDHAFYFIPGYNGVPGQIRFALPSIARYYGSDIYIRCLHLEAFSAKTPVWEKFTKENIEQKHKAIAQDLSELDEHFRTITIIVNSSGFYDFKASYDQIPETVKAKSQLAWIACAPDWMEQSAWENFFYKINGFKHNNYPWFAYPNHNALMVINKECSATKRWHHGPQKKTFFKTDLESRFHFGKLLWDYFSFPSYNWMIQHNVNKSSSPIEIPTVVLVAEKDGYWWGNSREVIAGVIQKYIPRPKILYKPTTHLWVTVPEHLSATLECLQRN